RDPSRRWRRACGWSWSEDGFHVPPSRPSFAMQQVTLSGVWISTTPTGGWPWSTTARTTRSGWFPTYADRMLSSTPDTTFFASHSPTFVHPDQSLPRCATLGLPWRNFRLVRTKRLDDRSNPRIVRTIRGCRLAVQPLPALHTKAVSAQIVMSARGAHQAPRRICLQPALVLAPVPDAVLRSEHPSPAFAIE